MRAARWETAPTAYCASASGRIIGRVCDGKVPKTPSKTPYQKGRFVAREPPVAEGVSLSSGRGWDGWYNRRLTSAHYGLNTMVSGAAAMDGKRLFGTHAIMPTLWQKS